MLTALRLLRIALMALITVALFAGCASPPEPEERGPIVFPKPPDPPRFIFERTLLGTGSARKLTSEDTWKQLLTGTAVSEGTGFGKPFDVAVKQGRVYVSDTVQRSVLVLDFPNGDGFVIGDRGDDGDLAKPLGIAIDDAGMVYVSDITYRAVMIYNAKGDFQRQLDLSQIAKRPSGVDVTPDGKTLFVVDTGGVDTEEHHVLVVKASNGDLVRKIGVRGKNAGELNLPRDVALGPDGLLYVSDGGNFRVQVFTQDGKFVREWGQPGRRLGQFSRPKGISIDNDGNIYVVDAAFGNFQIFNPEGQLLMFIGGRSTTPAPAMYMLPAGIDVDEDGRVYVIDQFFRKLDVFRPASLDEKDGWLAKQLEKKK